MTALSRFPIVAAVGLGAGLGFVGFAQQGAAQDYTLNVNTALTQDDPLYKGLEMFEAAVEERTGGDLDVVIFSASALGKDEDVLEQARAGANVAVVVDGGRLAVYVTEFGILGAPYLAHGFEGVRKVVTSDEFEGWVRQLREASGHQVLSFNWWQGERHLLTNVEVNEPADLSGIRMRTPGAPVWVETIRAAAAEPTPMGWTEVYSGLQQQVIDAAEAQHPASYGQKLYEVIDTITLTGHINLITGVVTSASWFDSLPAEYQTILREESLAAGDEASRLTQESLAEYERLFEEQGVAVNAIDTAPFEEATAGVYETLGYTELREKLRPVLEQ